VAALDCGSNSTRLLVAAADGATLSRIMHITRLGEGVDATGKLAPEAVDRTLRVLSEFRHVMDQHNVRRARLVATSAVRDAVNGEDFLSSASAVVGVKAELLEGLEEGRLAYAGATADLPPVAGDDVVVDIGGGSTELVISTPSGIGVVSIELGCVRLTERYFRHDPPQEAEIAQADEAIELELTRAITMVPQLGTLRRESRLIGLAGTVSTLAALQQRLAVYDRDRLHHFVLGRDMVEHWYETLAAEPARARARRPGMVEHRHDVIVAGILILGKVMDRLGSSECLVSESDILDGLADSLLS